MGEEEGLLETLPSDEARWGLLTLPLPPDKALPMGTGTGTKGDAILAAAPPTRIPRYKIKSGKMTGAV